MNQYSLHVLCEGISTKGPIYIYYSGQFNYMYIDFMTMVN